jgi:hypothetical protein
MKRSLVYCVLMALAAFPQASWATTFEPPDVHEIESSPDGKLGRELRLTGRFSSAAAGHLRLVGSRIDFQLGPDVRPPANPRHLLLVGTLVRQGSGLVFRVQTLLKLPPEKERFDQFQRRIATINNYPALYDLARWARQRGQWYGDDGLLRLGRQADQQAFHWEAEDLTRRGDADNLFRLADRAADYEVEGAEAVGVRFQALWLKYTQLAPADAATRFALADQVQQLLPGSRQPAPDRAPLPSLREAAAHYRLVDAHRREAIARAFYVKLMREAFELEAGSQRLEFGDLASQVRQRIPEAEDLARRFELLDLDKRAASIGDCNRAELLSLRDAYLRLNRPERARRLLTDWLEERRRRLPPDDLESRIALANDYRDLSSDRTAAAELLREALAIAPSPDAETGLARLGYVKRGGQWVEDGQSPGQPASQKQPVRQGDSEQSVLARLRQPDYVSRVAGAGWIVEQWRYQGPPEIWIYLRRSTATGSAVVTRVTAP